LTVADPLVNPLTGRRIAAFIKRPSHALLLQGSRGSGLESLADHVRCSCTSSRPDAEAYVPVRPNEKGTTTIDDIRGLARRLKLHSAGEGISIVAVITDAGSMTQEAQNALLKLLEEPPLGVLFILLSHDASRILPTISSRCVSIEVLPVSLSQAQAYFGMESEAFRRHYRLSGGEAGLLADLVDNHEHPLVTMIENAKRVLSAPAFERLKLIENEFKKKDQAVSLIEALQRVCRAGMLSGKANARWAHNSRTVVAAQRQLEANVQPKLVLDRLFLDVR
jgi:hypothetical protein